MWGGAEERKNGGRGGEEKEKEGEAVDSKKTDNRDFGENSSFKDKMRIWCQ